MGYIIRSIDELIEERSLLKHPFYQMWSAGELTKESLAGYSREYFQLVKAVPSFMDSIMANAPATSDTLEANRREELDHIAPWEAFAACLGVDDLNEYGGLVKTRQAVDELHSLMGDYVEGSCAMYALEKEIPIVSQTKLDGLSEFYSITDAGATEYFRLHTEADIRHAAVWRQIIEPSASEHLLDVAERSVSAQNLLLDGCYEEYCTS